MITIHIREWVGWLIIIAMCGAFTFLGALYGRSQLKTMKAEREAQDAISIYELRTSELNQEHQRDSLILDNIVRDNENIFRNIKILKKAGNERRYEIINMHADSVLMLWHRMESGLDSLITVR